MEGLQGGVREGFLNEKVANLIGPAEDYLGRDFVRELTKEKNFELGATTALWASKCSADPQGAGGQFLRLREKLYTQLSGLGIEIGALEHPANLPESCQVKYCDVINTNKARELFPELNHLSLVEVDVLVDLDKSGLKEFEDESQDFIIINHVLEHLYDPMNAIAECFRVLTVGGKLIIAVPDKNYTFDSKRPLTSLDEIESRKQKNRRLSLPEDYYDIVKYVHPELLELHPQETNIHLKRFKERREHLNIWDSNTFQEFIQKTVGKFNLPAIPIEEFFADYNSFEYLGLWQKKPLKK